MKSLFTSLTFIFIAVASVSFAEEVAFQIIVPAYAYPPVTWQTLNSTAENPERNFEIHAIANPGNGPGTVTDPVYVQAITEFRNRGGIVHGYVATRMYKPVGEGHILVKRPIQDIKDDIDRWLIELYPGLLDGIFFDQMSNDLAELNCYQELNDYVANQDPGLITFGNPGTTFINDPTGNATLTEKDFLNTFDTTITFESTAADYQGKYTDFSYLDSLAPNQVGHILHTQGTWNPATLETANRRGAGFIYVTDDVLANPYDLLPTYWSEFVESVSQFNSQTGVFALGNLNGDDAVNLLDVAPFIETLTSGEYRIQADTNCDGQINLLDVAPFVELLSGS